MSVLLRIAWRNIGRHRRRSALTAGAMAFGVGMSMAVIALSDGTYTRLTDTLTRQEIGHVQVHAPGYPKMRALQETMPERILAAVEGVEGTLGAAPRVRGFALLGAGDESAGGQVLGVAPEREAKVTLVHDRIVAGRWLSPRADHEILLGERLARTLGVSPGDEVVAVTQAADGGMGNDLYRVAGVFRTGSATLDRAGAFLHLDDAQSLFAVEGRFHELAIRGDDPETVAPLARRVAAALAGEEVLVRTWQEVDPATAQIIATQDASTWLLLIIVFVVAGFGVLNTMLMSVFERIRELGVLRALGLTPWQIVGLVMSESLLLGLLGGAAGVAFGLALDLALVHWGIDLTRFTDGFSFAGVTFDPVLRGEIRGDRIVSVVASLLAVALAASIWPALRAARLNPVQAMREQ